MRAGTAHIGNGDSGYVAVDPATAGRLFDIGVIDGSIAGLADDGLLVDDDEAAKRHIGMGDQLGVTFVNGTSRILTVEGIYTEQDLAGPFVVSHALHEQSGADQFDFAVYIGKAPAVSDADAEAAVARVADAYANAELQSRTEFIDDQAAQIDQLVNLMYGLLALAVVIALFSIANSMALSIYERTREIGLLRAVGMTRAQTRRSVGWESVLISLLGAGLGVVIGVFFGWAISVTIRDAGLGVATVPSVALAVIVVLAVLGGVIAAVRPAWRAAHVDVLSAIASE